MSSAICFNLDQSKILSSGTGSNQIYCHLSILQNVLDSYRLESSYYTDLEINATPWDEVINIPHNDSQTAYTVTLQDLLPDSSYNFRVNVRQKDGDKLQQKIMNGDDSGFVFVQCTGKPILYSTQSRLSTTSGVAALTLQLDQYSSKG